MKNTESFNIRFVDLDCEYIELAYDPTTMIVYIKSIVYSHSYILENAYIFTAYYGPNDRLCKYNPETNYLEEIKGE